MRQMLRRVLAVTVAGALMAGVLTACNDSQSPQPAPTLWAESPSSVVPEAFVYGNQAYCVYPDDLDDLSHEAVADYCQSVIDPNTGNPVAERYWYEADEPKTFNEASVDLSTLAWIYYLTYMNRWFNTALFINRYVPIAHQTSYLTRHAGYRNKYSAVAGKYDGRGVFVAPDGRRLKATELNGYTIAPRGCKPIAWNGQDDAVVLVGASRAPARSGSGSGIRRDVPRVTTPDRNQTAPAPAKTARPGGSGATKVNPTTPLRSTPRSC